MDGCARIWDRGTRMLPALRGTDLPEFWDVNDRRRRLLGFRAYSPSKDGWSAKSAMNVDKGKSSTRLVAGATIIWHSAR